MLRIRDVYPGSRIVIFVHLASRIPDLGARTKNSNKRGGGGGIGCPTFFVATNITKLEIILFFNWKRKKFS